MKKLHISGLDYILSFFYPHLRVYPLVLQKERDTHIHWLPALRAPTGDQTRNRLVCAMPPQPTSTSQPGLEYILQMNPAGGVMGQSRDPEEMGSTQTQSHHTHTHTQRAVEGPRHPIFFTNTVKMPPLEGHVPRSPGSARSGHLSLLPGPPSPALRPRGATAPAPVARTPRRPEERPPARRGGRGAAQMVRVRGAKVPTGASHML